MVVDDPQFMNFIKGKRVKLTLKTSSFLGFVQRINANKTLVLADVSGSDGCRYPGSKLFFGHEILNVEFINEAKRGSGDCQQHRLEENLKVERFQPYRKNLTYGDDNEGEEECVKFEVIDEFHEKFGPAVMHIKKQQVVGLGADGVHVYKHGRLCWLQIATKNKVYLFDILLLGARAFKNGLSMILESRHILKVIHDCRAVAGCLIAQFGVQLANVFDTQVADVMCFHSETGGFLPDRVSTLQEVVTLHLKVPSSQLRSLQIKSQLTEEEAEMWDKRPCPVPLLKVMALSVIHLQPLRLVLLDTLMTDYMALVDSYLNSSYYHPGELEHVSMKSVLELPRELRQLQKMRCDRQEWAAKHYLITEEGFLARFNPLVQSPTKNSSAEQEQSQTFLESATVEPPSSTRVEPLLQQTSMSPPRDNNVLSEDVLGSPDPDLKTPLSVNSPLSLGQGHTDTLMSTMGRGWAFGKEQLSTTALPTIGRGFLLHIPQAQTSRESTGGNKTPDRRETASGPSPP